MPAYLVQLPSGAPSSDLGGASDVMIIFAANAAGARSAAAGRFSDRANEQWLTLATVTEIVAGVDLADAGDGWSCYCRISGAAGQTPDPIVVEVDGRTRDQSLGLLGKDRLHISETVVINDGGVATYVVDDILTVAGGTVAPGGRAATLRVTSVSTGVIDGIELVDPGEYSVLPSLTANAVVGGGGSGALMDLAQADVNGYEALISQMVTELEAVGLNPSVDFSENGSGTRLLTLATGGGGDDIGDGTVEFEIRQHGVAFAPLVSTITDEGLSTAVLSVAIPASPLAPARTFAFKS